jgi:hypothetical protein
VLYLATDQGADKALEPDGFATLQASAGASGAQALKHVPMDVKVWCGRVCVCVCVCVCVERGAGRFGFERTIDPSKSPLYRKQNLSYALADELMDAMDALPDGPALVVCSSGGRASAVKCLRQVRVGTRLCLRVEMKDFDRGKRAPAPNQIYTNTHVRAKQALQEGWTRDAALAHAQQEGLPFIKNAHLTDWVLGAVARCVDVVVRIECVGRLIGWLGGLVDGWI